MQIHIDLSLPYDKQIKIFSKSRKDSTLDRIATHSYGFYCVHYQIKWLIYSSQDY